MEQGGGIEPLDILPAVLRLRLRRPLRGHLAWVYFIGFVRITMNPVLPDSGRLAVRFSAY